MTNLPTNPLDYRTPPPPPPGRPVWLVPALIIFGAIGLLLIAGVCVGLVSFRVIRTAAPAPAPVIINTPSPSTAVPTTVPATQP